MPPVGFGQVNTQDLDRYRQIISGATDNYLNSQMQMINLQKNTQDKEEAQKALNEFGKTYSLAVTSGSPVDYQAVLGAGVKLTTGLNPANQFRGHVVSEINSGIGNIARLREKPPQPNEFTYANNLAETNLPNGTPKEKADWASNWLMNWKTAATQDKTLNTMRGVLSKPNITKASHDAVVGWIAKREAGDFTTPPPQVFDTPSATTNEATARERADVVGKITKSQEIIKNFESDPKAVEVYRTLSSSTDFSNAMASGDLDAANLIMAKLFGNDSAKASAFRSQMVKYGDALSDLVGDIAKFKDLGGDENRFKPKIKKETSPKSKFKIIEIKP